LGVTATDIVFEPAVGVSGQPVSIRATIRNLGFNEATNVDVAFLDFDSTLGRTMIASIPAGSSAVTTVQATFAEASLRLISVRVDPDNLIAEVNEANNEASKLLQVGQPDPSQATMVIQPSAPTVCQGESASISGQAHYDFSQVPGQDDHPVQGGAVKVVIVDPATGNVISTFTGALTNINGFFSQAIIAPTSDGVYPVRVEVTDKTITQETQTTLTVSGACPEPPTVPPPPPSDPGPGTPPPSGPPDTPPSATYGDVYVRSADIYFSDDNPDPGEDITIFTYIRYYGEEPAFDIPVTLYDIVPINGTLTFIELGSTLVSFVNGGSSSPVVVSVPWTANPEGAQVIQVVVEPPFDQFTGNDKATRLIVVGDVPLLAIQKEVTLLVDADANGVISPGDRLLYTISYQNNGTGDAVNATIIDDFDESLLLTPNPISNGGTVANGVITWHLGTLGAQASGSVNYEVDIISAAEFPTGRTVIENVALLTADDSPADADSADVEVLVNSPPTVDAGADQTVYEGDTVSLAATGDDYDGDLITYSWDLDGDGVLETSGQNATFVAADGPETITVTVRVSDTGDLLSSDQLVVVIRNVAPTAVFSVPLEVNRGDDINLSLIDPTDPSPADSSAV
ncbi:MAG: hypothetical protein HC802_14410, partial [Caldilineaceae bacterium]|nr:hypothetical protein [Caldilineaceae bacterium]